MSRGVAWFVEVEGSPCRWGVLVILGTGRRYGKIGDDWFLLDSEDLPTIKVDEPGWLRVEVDEEP